MHELTDKHEVLPDCDCQACALASRDRLRAALLNCARQAEALKREASMDQDSALSHWRNTQYQSISTTAHIALGTIQGPESLGNLTREQAKAIMRMARELEDSGRMVALTRGSTHTDLESSDWRARNRNVQCALQDYLEALVGA